MDVDSFTLSMYTISGFFSLLFDKFLEWLYNFLYKLANWLYQIHVNRFSKPEPSELVDFEPFETIDIKDLNQNELMNKKQELKGKLWESLDFKPSEDTPWYKDKNTYIIGGIVIGLALFGGVCYYLYIRNNNEVPVNNNIPRPEFDDDHSRPFRNMNPDSNAEAGPSNSNDIELQDSSSMESYSSSNPWDPETQSEYNRYFQEPEAISRTSSPSGSDSTVTMKSSAEVANTPQADKIQPSYQGDENSNFLEWGKRAINNSRRN